VLEASAGTGKTRVLVDRYVRLIVDAGVDPKNILAITFTRKAAAEMRDRVLDTLRAQAEAGRLAPTHGRRCWPGCGTSRSRPSTPFASRYCASSRSKRT
jgi:superfamily I DNA/RNA helicase